MSGYCFFTPETQELAERSGIREEIENYAEAQRKQTYVLSKPLSKEDSIYDYEHALVIFSSGSRPCFVDLNGDEEKFEDYMEDFFDDISFLSEKFKYRIKIGRKKHWVNLFDDCLSDELNLESLKLEKPSDKRTADLLTSLVIGSVNDIDKINIEADSLLELVKSKIVLFDTDQTSFVFKPNSGKKYVIQGLAGSGKTELLLHKLKEIYSSEQDARIAFTCYNKILASSMKSRIPNFFDFMRVERQIDWNHKLFCFHAWGSSRDPYSGMYRYICHSYGISFGSMQAGSFDYLCEKAIKEIRSIPSSEFDFIFDYVFIDESQDFSESFINLCDLVTEKKLYVAGDVFQNIFRPIDVSVAKSDLVLKKCYRTDPRNLMFSHALGMGLYEQPVLRWLKAHEWEACGYNYEVQRNNRAIVSRDPLRRFEDIPDEFSSTYLHTIKNGESISQSIFKVIKDIIGRHKTISEGDIAVIFLDSDKYIYDAIATLKNLVSIELGWNANVSFETKRSDPDRFFISNINNAKGLEFPFVICFSLDLHRVRSFRNALYTMMARSFLESHLVVRELYNTDLIKVLNDGLNCINVNGYMDIRIPPEDEIPNQDDMILWDEKPSLEDYVRDWCRGKKATPRLVGKLISRLNKIVGDEDYDEEYLDSILEIEYDRNLKL